MRASGQEPLLILIILALVLLIFDGKPLRELGERLAEIVRNSRGGGGGPKPA
jgi:Sec-independent protein translocase protein TatA